MALNLSALKEIKAGGQVRGIEVAPRTTTQTAVPVSSRYGVLPARRELGFPARFHLITPTWVSGFWAMHACTAEVLIRNRMDGWVNDQLHECKGLAD